MSILKRSRWTVLVVVLAMTAAACGSDDADDTTADETTTTAAATTTEATTEDTTSDEEPEDTAKAVCEVTDTGGVDDKSFNQLAFDGAKLAEAELGWEARVLESNAETDYDPNSSSFVAGGDCELIVTVGFLLGAATETAANANPDQAFAIVDFAYGEGAITAGNVQGLIFAIDQAAFLAWVRSGGR